ncbi:MAG: endolytic transglycosylase MltG, partial [Bacteroidota bacterium]|nr:endolytic transglycosylase MltG [Bacteroidota bacterium]
QKPLKLVFNNIRNIENLAGRVAKKIEADSSAIVNLMHNNKFIEELGFNKYTYTCIFIPNTYEFWWNTSAKSFVLRMHKEYLKFWNTERKAKAKKLNLSKEEVITIASIVDEETYKNDEMPRIAGVYINRLRKRIPLQADPTIKFAVGDFSIKRVLTKHLKTESPYNTYKHYGLPPGPISIPSIAAIDAVLNYEHHKYLYFCAKDDFSGYHNFAKNLYEHNRNARAYRRALNKKRIWK